jgi:hypothetical protein
MSQYPNLVARQIGPKGDKSHSFQAVKVTQDRLYDLRSAMASAAVKAANPFLQGNSGEWIMIEFWTKDLDLVNAACQNLAESLHTPLFQGDFSRKELGLE